MNTIPDFRKWKIPDDEGSVIGLFRRNGVYEPFVNHVIIATIP